MSEQPSDNIRMTISREGATLAMYILPASSATFGDLVDHARMDDIHVFFLISSGQFMTSNYPLANLVGKRISGATSDQLLVSVRLTLWRASRPARDSDSQQQQQSESDQY